MDEALYIYPSLSTYFLHAIPISLFIFNDFSFLLYVVHGMEFIAQKIPLILYGFPLNYVCCTLYRKKPKLVQDIEVSDVSARSFFIEQFRKGTYIEEPLTSPPTNLVPRLLPYRKMGERA